MAGECLSLCGFIVSVEAVKDRKGSSMFEPNATVEWCELYQDSGSKKSHSKDPPQALQMDHSNGMHENTSLHCRLLCCS